MSGLLSSVKKSTRYRPKLDLPLTKPEIILEIIAFAGVLAIISMALAYWSKLPELVPTHFNVAGEADAWGQKSGILMMPAIVFILHIILTVVSRFPHLFNYPVRITEYNAKKEYLLARYLMNILKLLIVWMFFLIFRFTVFIAMGEKTNLGSFMWYLLVAIFIVIIGYFFLSIKFAKKA